MHIIFFNTKGGVSKSTLCEYSSRELRRSGYAVSVENTDQQNHVTLINNENADFFLYDTIGAFTAKNTELLKAAKHEKAVIIIPMNIGKNDASELPFLISRLEKFGIKEKSHIVFTKTRKNSKLLKERKQLIIDGGLNLIDWVMPTLDDFADLKDTKRTKSEIEDFLKESIL